MYNDLTDIAAGDIENIVEHDKMGIDNVVKKIENIEKRIKLTAFGKTRVNSNKVRKTINKGSEVTDDELIKGQSEKIQSEIRRTNSRNLGRVVMGFKIKEIVNGPKKTGKEPTEIRDHKKGNLVVANEEIKKDNLTQKSVGSLNNLKYDLNNLRM